MIEGERIYLVFTHINSQLQGTVQDNNCTNYHIQVKDGDDADAPLIGNFCINRIPHAITSQGDLTDLTAQLLIHFAS